MDKALDFRSIRDSVTVRLTGRDKAVTVVTSLPWTATRLKLNRTLVKVFVSTLVGNITIHLTVVKSFLEQWEKLSGKGKGGIANYSW